MDAVTALLVTGTVLVAYNEQIEHVVKVCVQKLAKRARGSPLCAAN